MLTPSSDFGTNITVRAPTAADAAAMARVHVETWQETYRGQMPDAALDDPANYSRRQSMWETLIEQAPTHGSRIAVACVPASASTDATAPDASTPHAGSTTESAIDRIVGIALAQPRLDPRSEGPDAAQQRAPGSAPAGEPNAWDLHTLYVYRKFHGTGAGVALLQAVTSPAEDTYLRVAEQNQRARAFYAKHGFAPTGASSDCSGIPDIEMFRPSSALAHTANPGTGRRVSPN